MDIRVAHRYRLSHRIGSGSFGEIYSGIDIFSNMKVAVKLESKFGLLVGGDNKNSEAIVGKGGSRPVGGIIGGEGGGGPSLKVSQLAYEARVYEMLHKAAAEALSIDENVQIQNRDLDESPGKKMPNSESPTSTNTLSPYSSPQTSLHLGVPQLYWYGTEGDFNVMVISLLGPSLEDLFTLCSRKFSLKTVLMLADQFMKRVQILHQYGLIHRDLKPENLLMGVGNQAHLVFLVDLGLAKRYRDRLGMHIDYKDNKKLTGTARYASVNTHLGFEQSRRDDLESLGYVLMYFLRGSLPWQNLHAPTKSEKYARISQKKMGTDVTTLCEGYPKEFATYLSYVRSLRFEDKPDYQKLRKLFRDLFVREGFMMDHIFDW
eukprot:CAMPEP_0117445474 /NCGR_PEP_ID=MMETSP0759-20121206/5815_1 /TAXON_ID=63605 /ORGANISM="Percolomonas cosmopolitus, Strain WS" /LENGTH=374 /DNA_ID=CAMNT_0005237653 /DNA_START=162 /DNA_END=1283 /DNA_ORIENTATION=+